MKKMRYIIGILLFTMFMGEPSQAQDWAELIHFKDENVKLGLPSPGENRVVFMGNSITAGWDTTYPDFFSGKLYINRGISGQTTPQMLLRFRADVIALKPAVVVILAGTNDIAGNTGPSTLEMILDNIMSMCELSKSNGIKVVLCSVLPAYDYPWKPGLNPAEKIFALNEMIKKYAAENGIIYLDYYSSLVNKSKGMITKYAYDGVHPNKAGYQIMATLTEAAIAKALNQK